MSLGLHLRAKHSQVFRLGQVVSLLQMSSGELSELLAQEAQDNPMLVLRPRPAAGLSATDLLEMTAVEEANSLYNHVFRELAGLMSSSPAMERLITALIAELEPSGWLGASTGDIAKSLDLSVDLVETALNVVQKRIEPAGLFARDLQDCLRLQLEDRGMMNESFAAILSCLALLETGGVSALVKACGLDPDQVMACLDALRELDPKPGSAFVTDQTLLRQPDVRITPSDDGWDIEFLSSFQSDIQISQLPRQGRTSDTSDALARARALKHALDIRVSALKQVVGELVKHQGDYFRDGASALVPMTMSNIAKDTGFHLSTVSRVMNGLLIEGPCGIVAARTLFSGPAAAGCAHSKTQVQARIRALLSGEDPSRPMSDRRLAVLLQAEGIPVSRRVVSNYRQDSGILAAAKRRRRA